MKFDYLTEAAIKHTLHCLAGCAVGEILGMVIGTTLGWNSIQSITLAVTLAFVFGYALTFYSTRRSGMGNRQAVKTTLVTDTTSIASMEIIDNLFIVLVPGALEAELDSGLFWWSLLVSLVVAFILTVLVNRWFLSRSGQKHHH